MSLKGGQQFPKTRSPCVSLLSQQRLSNAAWHQMHRISSTTGAVPAAIFGLRRDPRPFHLHMLAGRGSGHAECGKPPAHETSHHCPTSPMRAERRTTRCASDPSPQPDPLHGEITPQHAKAQPFCVKAVAKIPLYRSYAEPTHRLTSRPHNLPQSDLQVRRLNKQSLIQILSDALSQGPNFWLTLHQPIHQPVEHHTARGDETILWLVILRVTIQRTITTGSRDDSIAPFTEVMRDLQTQEKQLRDVVLLASVERTRHNIFWCTFCNILSLLCCAVEELG